MSVFDTLPAGVAPMHKMIASDKYKDIILKMRAMPTNSDQEIKEQKAVKANNLPCMFCCVFEGGTKNENAGLAEVIIVDSDGADNFLSLDEMMDKLAARQEVAVVARSVRNGVYSVHRIPPTNSNEMFHEIARSLEEELKRIGIIIDPACKNISRKRFFGYSDKVFFNPNEPAVYEVRKANSSKNTATTLENSVIQDIEVTIQEIESRGLDIAPNYSEYLNIAFALASEFNESGRSLFHRVCRQSAKYSYPDADKKFDDALKNAKGSVQIGTFYHYVKQAGIQIAKRRQALLPHPPRRNVTIKRKIENIDVLKDGSVVPLTAYGYPAIWDNIPTDIINENRNLLNNHL